MKNYKIFKNFLTERQCDILSEWILENKDKSFFKDANMKGIRLTTRYSNVNDFIFPKESYKIKEKIINKLKIKKFNLPSFKDGMIASYAASGDTCYNHKDPVWKENTITLHCNIKLSNNLGGNPVIENEKINLKKGDMWIYPVSNVIHGSDLITGKIPRTTWIFGFCIKQEDYDRLF
jgi:hypothetical protein